MNPIFWLYNKRKYKNMTLEEAYKLSDDEKLMFMVAKLDDALTNYKKQRRSELVGQY